MTEIDTRSITRWHGEHGTVLVQFVLFVFAFFAIAAAIVDLGLARFTQLSMQGASDSAALEGLRYVDATSDLERRTLAARLAGYAFDDDLDPSNGDPLALGAGPELELVDGLAGINASAEIVVDPTAPAAYDPMLEPNLADLRHGDMLAGRFLSGAVSHLEASDYGRDDFEPGASDSAFLVRLRRTNDPLGLDSVAGVSSRANALPYLFGLGSLLGMEARRAGITVRSTSIADSRTANSIATDGALPGPRLVDLALYFPSLPAVGDTLALSIESNGTLAQVTAGKVDLIGEFVMSAEPLISSRPSFVGSITERIGPQVLSAQSGVALPVIALEAGSGRRVVGFVVADIESPTATSLVLVRRASRLGANSTALSPRALGRLAASPALRARHFALAAPLLAPVLVR